MNEPYGRDNRYDQSSRNYMQDRDRDQYRDRQDGSRQQQQWHDDGSTFSQSARRYSEEDSRNRDMGQMGSSYGSDEPFSYDRSRQGMQDSGYQSNWAERNRAAGQREDYRRSQGLSQNYPRSSGGGFDRGNQTYGYTGGASEYGFARNLAGNLSGHPSREAGSSRDEYSSWRSYGEERGFFEKAGDEIASWFGDEDAARRREQDHRGKGPSNYTRSDERIREDANDHLTHDSLVDATNVHVTVSDGEITLEGKVPNRQAKRRAEDCVENIPGVKHVQNNLRVADTSQGSGLGSTTTQAMGSATSTTGSSPSALSGSTTAAGTTTTAGKSGTATQR